MTGRTYSVIINDRDLPNRGWERYRVCDDCERRYDPVNQLDTRAATLRHHGELAGCDYHDHDYQTDSGARDGVPNDVTDHYQGARKAR